MNKKGQVRFVSGPRGISYLKVINLIKNANRTVQRIISTVENGTRYRFWIKKTLSINIRSRGQAFCRLN